MMGWNLVNHTNKRKIKRLSSMSVVCIWPAGRVVFLSCTSWARFCVVTRSWDDQVKCLDIKSQTLLWSLTIVCASIGYGFDPSAAMFVLKNSKKNHPLNNPSVLLFCAQLQQIQTPKWLILRHRTPFSGRKTPRRTWWRGGKSCGPAPDWLRSSSRPVKCRPEGSGSCPSIQLSDSNVSLKESPNLISFGSRYTSYTFLTYLYINIWRKLIACATLIGSLVVWQPWRTKVRRGGPVSTAYLDCIYPMSPLLPK
jgi:hypothetical protein